MLDVRELYVVASPCWMYEYLCHSLARGGSGLVESRPLCRSVERYGGGGQKLQWPWVSRTFSLFMTKYLGTQKPSKEDEETLML